MLFMQVQHLESINYFFLFSKKLKNLNLMYLIKIYINFFSKSHLNLLSVMFPKLKFLLVDPN